MINGFEDETTELTYEEKLLVPRFQRGLWKCQGKANAITSVQIERKLKADGIKCTGARIRKIINYIRIKGIVPRLLATSDGYFVSDNEEEIRKYVESLDQRINAIKAVRDAMAGQLDNFRK